MPTPRDPTDARTLHHRITSRHAHRGSVPGMHQPSKVTPVGKTARFQVSYLTTLGKKGDTLARAILHNCERDYADLKKFFGGLTPPAAGPSAPRTCT